MPAFLESPVTKARYAQVVAGLKQDRDSFEAHWKELGDFFMPRRTRFWVGDRNRGDKRNQQIINSTGRFAARTLQSGLHSGLTSPARPWMKLTTPDQDLAAFGPVQEWLHIVTQRMLTVFAVSNLYNVLPIVYGDMGVFGTACMAIVEDSRDLFRAYAYPIGSYWLGQDARGMVTTLVREYRMTVRQVVEQFALKADGREIDWTKLSKTVKDLWDAQSYEAAVDVTWIVTPNEAQDRQQLEARFLPWASCHYETNGTEDKFLRQSGFRTFPIMAPRWDITGEDTYGTSSPGIDTLGDNKQLQIMERRKGQAINKMVDPPLVGPSSLRTQKTSLLAGDITYVDTREGMQGLKSIHDVQLNLEHLSRDIANVEYRIQRGFYEDLFLMLARADEQRGMQPPTAREIEERHEEKLLALGPVLERTNDELLDPIVDRVFALMDVNGMLPPAPPDIEGVDLKVEYISILSQAQKLVGVVGQDRFLSSMVPLIEVFPEIRAKIDTNRVVNNYVDMLGVDPRTVRSDEEADQLVAQERQQAQAAAQAEQAANLGRAAKDASQAKLGTDSALDALVSSAGA